MLTATAIQSNVGQVTGLYLSIRRHLRRVKLVQYMRIYKNDVLESDPLFAAGADPTRDVLSVNINETWALIDVTALSCFPSHLHYI